MTIGEKLREIRNNRNQSLRDVEEDTGITRGYISRLERDEIPNAALSRYKELADYYGVSIESIVNPDKNSKKDLKLKFKKEDMKKENKEDKATESLKNTSASNEEEEKIKRSYYLTEKQIKMVLKLNAEFMEKDMSQIVGKAIENYYSFQMEFKELNN